MTLIVVESPTKARTFNRILKAAEKPYEVYATVVILEIFLLHR